MNKTTEALKLAEALENDAKEHREVSYGLDCPPERTANWKHALNCEAAARLIREALAEQDKQEPVAVISESAIGLVKLHSNGVSLPFGTPLYAAPVQPVKQEPVAVVQQQKIHQSDVPFHYIDCQHLPVGTKLYAAPVSAPKQEKQEPVVNDADRSDAYDVIDRFLRNNLDDSDYEDYSTALDTIYAAPVSAIPERPQTISIADLDYAQCAAAIRRMK